MPSCTLSQQTSSWCRMQLLVHLLVGAFVMPFHIVRWINFTCWSSGQNSCKALQSLDIHMTSMSVFHLTGVAAERYVRIAHPFFYERWVRKILPWVIAVFWIIPAPGTFFAIFFNLHQPESHFVRAVGNTTEKHYNRCGKGDMTTGNRRCRCSFWASDEFTAVTFFYQYLVPMFFILFFYARIFAIGLRQANRIEKMKASLASNSNLHELAASSENRRSVVSQSGDTAATSGQSQSPPTRRLSRVLFFSKDIQVVRLCAVILLVFLICQTPYFVMMLLEAFCYGIFLQSDDQILHPDNPEYKRNDDRLTFAFFCVLWLCLLNSLINPILLFLLEKSYRMGFKLLVFRRLPKVAAFLRMTNPVRANYMRNMSRDRNSESHADGRQRLSVSFSESASQMTLM
ncbi:trace amine-associated receptor 1-like isoform X2 [Paramacrobiotus metropolitanus]|uniref:trace amine-associated receptor 1-like isoform X2 n=1 Tax=Paramacrobiotus metropolitanus TaxID=2943436 RepID=UPI002445953D|nr:trace amine-associated receptor 1-like isoform X2 [Paramacrobiotus metropolitanus]